jgi:hypothetical protein
MIASLTMAAKERPWEIAIMRSNNCVGRVINAFLLFDLVFI